VEEWRMRGWGLYEEVEKPGEGGMKSLCLFTCCSLK
jgi:hypothetical protein